MPIKLNGSTSGYTQLSAPATAGNNTLTLPTGNGTSGQVLTTDGSGVLSWGASVSTTSSQLAKAWVNWNGTGTVAIRSQFNVSSITDNGVGDYTVNFTSAMADANYSIATGVNYDNASNVTNTIASAWASATSSCRVQSKGGGGGGMSDAATISATIFAN